MAKAKKTSKAKNTKKAQKRTKVDAGRMKKSKTAKQIKKTGKAEVKSPEQKVLDEEEQKLREELDVPQCPHCGHDKRTEKELKTGVCNQCKKEDVEGESTDLKRPDIGAAAHNRRAYERARLSDEELLMTIAKLNKNGVPVKQGKGGRPKLDPEKVVQFLVEAFRLDATVEEACSYAGISTSWYHEEKKRNKEFLDKITRAKSYPFLVAKGSVVGAMEAGDQITGLKYLERRQKKQYSPRVEVTGEDGDAIQIDVKSEAKKRAAKFKNPKTSTKKKK